jgi:CheY-like chemotaxis protein
MTAAPALILVVEDDADMIVALSALLADGGYRVLEARTGRAALHSARLHTPDLILLDLGLPEMNGLDVADHLRSDPIAAAIPIVALTGSWLAETQELFAAGFAGALRKPFRAKQLMDTVRAVLPTPTPTTSRPRGAAERPTPTANEP